MRQPIQIREVVAVTGGGLKKKKPWLPETKEVEECRFVKLSKWDPAFTIFCSGKAMQLRKDKDLHHCNVEGFNTLLDLRRTACNQLYAAQVRQAAASAGDPLPAKLRKAREQDQYIAGRIVTMHCPRLAYSEECLPEIDMKVLWSVSSPEIWVELLPENLAYVSLAIRKSLAEMATEAPPVRRKRKLRQDGEKSPPKRKRRRRAQEPAAEELEDVGVGDMGAPADDAQSAAGDEEEPEPLEDASQCSS